MPRISVIVPVYNAEKYLHACINSILMQTFSDFELILVDDGSTDKSGIICDEYGKIDLRIRVIHQKNQGQAAARNNALKESVAKWIHFVDGDDLIHPKMLELLYYSAENMKVRMAICGGIQGREEYSEQLWKQPVSGIKAENVLINEEALINLYYDPGFRYGTVWASLIDKSIIERIPFAVGKIYEDAAVFCQWLFEAKHVANLPIDLYYYRRHRESTTGKAFSLKRLDVLWAKEVQMDFFERINYPRMKAIKAESYIYSVAEFCNEVRAHDKSCVQLRELKRKALRVYLANRKHMNISPERKQIIMENLYPGLMKTYWIITGIGRRMKCRRWRQE